ncbi:hypothetical protein FB567DRAFT_518980 [Paraphoma chrysanthemicola]|uniref:Uncharacterized protein n=1 Tax=Paraphoma chrysanthemicola TaxID=798071 RepID=A0A8K0RBV9_9PLEO|nr:hypothetical protein FB567DRAFT_518980 [Paraphoma chrysanthemicola]
MASITDTNDMLILWGEVDPNTTDENALNDWWTNEHLPERLRLPGFVRARRYYSLGSHGKREYLAWYEVNDIQDLSSEEYLYALNHPTPRTQQFMPCLSTMNRSACRTDRHPHAYVGWNGLQNSEHQYLILLVLNLETSRDSQQAITTLLEQYVQKDTPPSIEKLRVHIAIKDSAITAAGTASKSYNDVLFKPQRSGDKIIALVELQLQSSPRAILDLKWAQNIISTIEATGLQVEHSNTYELLCSMDRSDVVVEADASSATG